MHGLLVIDKPQGLSSHAVVSRMRKLLQQRRIGHTGTLDPMATGVLPIAVGEGTRVIPFLREEQKTYHATIALGAATDTQDAEGEVVFRGSMEQVNESAILAAIKTLTGPQEQLPPMYSAIKKDGVPLYKLARKGQEVERKKRNITVYAWHIEEISSDQVICTIDCSRGTYVRTLAHDLGQRLGCGAHLTALRRLRSGPFEIDQALTLEDVAAYMERHEDLPALSMLQVVGGRACLELEEGAVSRLLDGVPPAISQVVGALPEAGAEVSLVYRDCLVGLAVYAPERAHEKRGDFELQRVFNQVREQL
ncbi:MAG: tRNA pseudouridine(55) synthase TruB [Desulfuromonas sp.]|nr:MAG: tRNA pseudouridine(55) synthase TruB [Desulfuromonas sp.]